MKTNTPKQICIDNTSFLPIVGGTETYCYQLLSSIPPSTAKLKLVCEVPSDGIDKLNDHPIMRFGRISHISGYDDSDSVDKSYGLGRILQSPAEAQQSLEKISNAGFDRYYDELFKHKPELIVINDLMRVLCAPYLQIAPFIHKTKLVINLHGILTSFREFWESFPEKKEFVIDFIKNYPNQIYFIAPSKYVYHEALNWGIKKENLRHIYIGVDINKFNLTTPQQKLKARNSIFNKLKLSPLDKDELLIGFPSRAVDHKGIDVALKAIKEVTQKRKIKGFKLLIAGGASSNPESLVNVKEMLEQQGVSGLVVLGTDMFINYPESMITFYQACDLCLFPSRRDALGYGALESMACGVPVIGTSIPGLCEAMGIEENGQGDCPGGWAIVNEDSKGLAAQINTVLEDTSILQLKGKTAREWIVDNFALTKMIEEHLELFEQISSSV